MKKFLFIGLLLSGMLISCEKESFDMEKILDEMEMKSNKNNYDGKAGFTLVYPVTLIMPDNSTVTGNSRKELSASLKQWYIANPKSGKEKPRFQYPVNIIFQGESLIINNGQEMRRIEAACAVGKGKGKGRDGDNSRGRGRGGDGDGEGKETCIELVYPVTYIMPDRSTITGNDPMEVRTAMARWYEANPNANKRHKLKYPVNIKFKGRPMTVNNEREMQRIRKACDD